jgi:hypothetical protein
MSTDDAGSRPVLNTIAATIPPTLEPGRDKGGSVMRASILVALILFLAACASTPPVSAPEPLGPAGQKWSLIEDSPRMVAFYKDTFDTLNFVVKDTGERFYLVHEGNRIRVLGGSAASADLEVPLTQQQVNSVALLGADGTLDDADAFAIMRIMFAPVARSFLTGSFLNNEIIRRLAGVEDLIHITFWTEGRPETSSVTLKAEGNHWSVSDGLDGRPKRIFRLNPAESQEYMRHVHATRNSLNPKVWIGFVTWYKRWQDRVSIVPAVA